MERKVELAERGLKEVEKYAVILYDAKIGWTCEVISEKSRADEYKGFGDFAGMGPIKCVVPINTGGEA